MACVHGLSQLISTTPPQQISPGADVRELESLLRCCCAYEPFWDV